MANTYNKLLGLRIFKNWDEKDVATELQMTVEEYKDLESGKEAIGIEVAKKLSDLYHVPVEYFMSNEVSVFHYNQGTGSNSNSGLIQAYYNYGDKPGNTESQSKNQ